MNVFEAVKENVTTRQAAETYGIKVNRNGMAVCPFHNDKNPSMKVDRRFHCFGCQADGDVIDFTAELFGLPVKEAVVKLAADFSIPYKTRGHDPPARKPLKRQLTQEQIRRQDADRCCQVLCDYLHLLEFWKEAYAPKPEDEIWHPLFVKALQEMERVNYQLDILWDGTEEEKIQLVEASKKDVMELEERIRDYTRHRQE